VGWDGWYRWQQSVLSWSRGKYWTHETEAKMAPRRWYQLSPMDLAEL
jgi:hypothetical protein